MLSGGSAKDCTILYEQFSNKEKECLNNLRISKNNNTNDLIASYLLLNEQHGPGDPIRLLMFGSLSLCTARNSHATRFPSSQDTLDRFIILVTAASSSLGSALILFLYSSALTLVLYSSSLQALGSQPWLRIRILWEALKNTDP